MSGPTAFSRSVRLATIALGIAGLLAMAASFAVKSSHSNSSLVSLVNIASLLDARSPGSRTQAEITKFKQASDDLDAPAESSAEGEPVLGKTVPSGTDNHLVATPEELLGPVFPFDQGLVLPEGESVEHLAGGLRAAPEFAWEPGVGGGGSSSGGGSGGEGPGGPPLAPVQIPAVPEPSTWALMLMGAAMCGASMRRQRSMQLHARVA